jgi:hypothetical protein
LLQIIEIALDCEKAWLDYTRLRPGNISNSRFFRYNVDLESKLPALDDVKALDSLQNEVLDKLTQDKARIQNLAFQLVATYFYFEVERMQ